MADRAIRFALAGRALHLRGGGRGLSNEIEVRDRSVAAAARMSRLARPVKCHDADDHEQTQQQLDDANAEFWSELCGCFLARELGVEDASAESLARFDRAYLEIYPYLERYLPWRAGERLLEIGLGYGTVWQLLAERDSTTTGSTSRRVRWRWWPTAWRCSVAGCGGARHPGIGARDTPSRRAFDVVVSIGCLHHTGDLAAGDRRGPPRTPRGREALVMLYDSHSTGGPSCFRCMIFERDLARPPARGGVRAGELRRQRGGSGARPTSSPRPAARRLFTKFGRVRVRRENFDDVGAERGRTDPAVHAGHCWATSRTSPGSTCTSARDCEPGHRIPGSWLFTTGPTTTCPRPFTDAATVWEHIHSSAAHSRFPVWEVNTDLGFPGG